MVTKAKNFLYDLYHGKYEQRTIEKGKQEQIAPEEIKLKCAFYVNLKGWIALNCVCLVFVAIQFLFGIPRLSNLAAVLIFLVFFLC